MGRQGYPLIKLLGRQGKKIDIIPTTRGEQGMNVTEIYNKKFEYLGTIVFDKRKRWNKYVLVDLDKEMQMSKDCLDEAFQMTEDYWKKSNS